MDTEEIIEQIIRTTRFATDIINKLPAKKDSGLQKTVKCISIIDSLHQKFVIDDRGLAKAIKKLKAKKIRSSILRDLFFQTDLKDDFSVSNEKISKYESLVNAKRDGTEINFVKYAYGTRDWVDDEFFVKDVESLNRVIEGLWRKYNGSIHVDYELDSISRKKKIKLSTIEINPDPLLGKCDSVLEQTVSKQQKFADLGISRTYCLIGKPGTGKSTFAYRFAKKISNRILRFNAQELGYVIHSIGPFIISLKPNVIIFDDFDRIPSLTEYMSSILNMITDIKRKFPNVIIILTANDAEKLGSALLRPGRIDEIIDFEPPGKDDIKLLLSSYMDSIGAEYTKEDLEVLADLSDGLSHSYIKELAIRKKILSIDEISSSIKRMKEISGIKAAPKKEETEEEVA